MDNKEYNKFVQLIIICGWLSLFISSVCFYTSTLYIDSVTLNYALWFFVARLFGIAAFIVGVFSLFNQRWTNGSLLIIGSVALPFASLLVYGKI